MSIKVSANIGFLWEGLPLPDRILAAHKAGFDAVECHFPYAHEPSEVLDRLQQTGLPMVGLNTALGPDGCFGLAALTGREDEARKLIDQAIDYANAINASNVNVVAGLTGGSSSAEQVYRSNLAYACDRAAESGKTIVIEPLNPRSVPDYHFSTVQQAMSTIGAVNRSNLKIMFDFFHAQIVEGDLEVLVREHIEHIGHIQVSAVHDRGEPDRGEINYPYLISVLLQEGYTGYIGAEYKPRGNSVESGVGWMDAFRKSIAESMDT